MFQRPIILLIRKTWALGAIIVLAISLIGLGSFKLTSVFSSDLKNKVIVIDPGHGGADPGAQNSGLKEKDVNLDISLRLRKVLESKGCTVILTREVDKDFFLPGAVVGRMAKRAELNNRISIASKNNADLFISVHANSFPQRNTYGMETYYHLKSSTGKVLAEGIQRQLTQLQPNNKRPAKAGDYYIIKQTKMPAVLVEVGFISNPKERKLLLTDHYRDLVADAIGTGIVHYFNDHPMGVPENSPTASAPEGPPSATENTYKLYYPNDTLESLIPEDREIHDSIWAKSDLSQKATFILRELIRGPQSGKSTPTIPSTTKVLSVIIQNNVATINFSRDIQDHFPSGALEEDITIKSIVWSLTQLPGINGVNILIDGEFGESLGGHILLDHTFGTQLKIVQNEV
ncbi:N-acetylmuramoyl-L-alanine amidase [Desulfosporosinus sp. Sb-LF]|uniref:N-acetylmuramoyl-L-alanine amidase n=1 Tax=Desulfosporosinus sp. Sb-LF TaxID=2560027 RepID=UPI00107F5649|nr:N-acetylmuramoyl-L-alanine amidase [Desulfosporosinus sp. Sb-LF]TGE31137.1 N-acetylmuramoyl-L-alanine amidase [Desulfosporosinus sp. Sb-LF]